MAGAAPVAGLIGAPRRVLPVLVLAQLAGTSPWFAVNAVMPELQRDFGWAGSDVGTLTSAVQLGFIAGTLLFALLTVADRHSPRRVFLLCSLASAACTVACALAAPSFAGVLLFRAMTGFFLAGIYPVGMKIASIWFPRGLGGALGWLIGALVLGSAQQRMRCAPSVPSCRGRRCSTASRCAHWPAACCCSPPCRKHLASARRDPAVARAGQHLDRRARARVGARLLRPHVGAVHAVGAGAGDPGDAVGRRRRCPGRRSQSSPSVRSVASAAAGGHVASAAPASRGFSSPPAARAACLRHG